MGENLADHYAVRIAARVCGAGSLNERARGPRLALEVLKYLVARRGILCSAVAHAYGFVRAAPGAGRADIQLLFAARELRACCRRRSTVDPHDRLPDTLAHAIEVPVPLPLPR